MEGSQAIAADLPSVRQALGPLKIGQDEVCIDDMRNLRGALDVQEVSQRSVLVHGSDWRTYGRPGPLVDRQSGGQVPRSSYPSFLQDLKQSRSGEPSSIMNPGVGGIG